MNQLKYWVSMVMLLLLAGCNVLGPAVDQHSYLFSTPEVSTVPTPLVKVFAMNPTRVEAAFSSEQFVYRLSEFRYATDYQNRFFVPLGQQLTTIIQRSLQRSGLAQQVLYLGGAMKAEILLKNQITAFYIDQRSDKPAAVVRWTFSVYKNHPLNQVLLKTWHYSQRIPLVDQQPIQAWNTAVSRIMQQFIKDLTRLLKSSAKSSPPSHARHAQ